MRNFIREQIIFFLMEGGNLPGVNSAVPREHLESTVSNGLSLANLKGLPYAVVGNKNKPFLGDVDVAVESQNVAKKIGFKGTNTEEFWNKLESHLKKSKVKHYKVVKGLSQFHIVIPLADKKGVQLNAVEDGTEKTLPGFVQLDFFIGDLSWMEKALSGTTNSKYKAVYRNLFFVDILSQLIFKTKNPDVKRKLQVNWKQGIEIVDFKYDEKGKKQKLKTKKITGDMDKFTKFLFGAKANFNNIDSFEKLYKLFKSNKFHFPKMRKSIIDAYKKTLSRYKLDIPKELK
jgi:hypothetical protein